MTTEKEIGDIRDRFTHSLACKMITVNKCSCDYSNIIKAIDVTLKFGLREGRKQLADKILPRLDTLYDLVLDLGSKVSYHVNISDHEQEFKKWIINVREKLKKEAE